MLTGVFVLFSAIGVRLFVLQVVEGEKYQQELKTKGKKLHQSDARFFAEAQKMLHSEFSVVLNIKQEEVLPFIMNELDMARA